MNTFKHIVMKTRWSKCSQLLLTKPDLGEDAGRGGHSAVHHTVEYSQQSVQGEGLGPQQVVTGLEERETQGDRKSEETGQEKWYGESMEHLVQHP